MTDPKFQRRTNGHPYAKIIERYYEACNTGNNELFLETLHPDMTHYYVDAKPTVGRDTLMARWQKSHDLLKAFWTMDHILIQDNEAVIEWSMVWTPPDTKEEEILRGTEWYIFEGDKILEVRSFHNNHRRASPANRELQGYDYDGRGYPPQP